MELYSYVGNSKLLTSSRGFMQVTVYLECVTENVTKICKKSQVTLKVPSGKVIKLSLVCRTRRYCYVIAYKVVSVA